MKIRRAWLWLLLPLLPALLAVPAEAMPEKAAWSARLEPADARAGEGAQIVVTARIEAPWHVYSTTQPTGGPVTTTISLAPNRALIAGGAPVQPPPKLEHDPGFNMQVELYEGAVAFGLPVKVRPAAGGAQKATVKVFYQLCKAGSCLPPKTVEMPVSFTVAPGAARPDRIAAVTAVPAQPPGAKTQAGKAAETGKAAGSADTADTTDLSKTAAATGAASPASGGTEDDIAARVRRAQSSGLSGIGPFLWLALSTGFLALLTPCVFPMIPITVSFFSKQESDAGMGRAGGAAAYCLGIIGTFTGLGLLISALFGAGGITRFAANPWLNMAMAALFTLLALNLFGVYEIVVPASLLNRIQPQRATASPGGRRRGRIIAPLLMGLAFTLTSFTCTVPFVGTLLVATAQGGALWPLLGMLTFSTAFAAPFFLLALFPQWLARLPKAGGWLVSVKAYMGFLELAAALKFLSNADMVWRWQWLTRPVFLAVWSTIAIIAGFYLLRWLRLPHDSGSEKPGVFRRALGVATVAVGVYLLASIGGASLGEFDAYLPPREYGMGAAYAAAAGPQRGAVRWIVDDYDKAVARAKAEGKPLLINFTGYTCTNCRLMEAHVLPRPEVVEEITNNFIAVELHTDGQDARSQRYQKLEQEKFGTVSIPLYVVVTAQGKELARLEGLHRDPQAFIAFLQKSESTARLALRRAK